MSKGKQILRDILIPNKKVLFIISIILYLMVGTFCCVHFLAKREASIVFGTIWGTILGLIGLYLLYGYLRILITELLEKKKEEKLITAFRKDKEFRSTYTRAAGILAAVFFVGWNIYKGIAEDSIFFWLVAEYFWFASIIKIYMAYIADREEGLKKKCSYIIADIGLTLLSGVVIAISCFIVYFDGIFTKSWSTVFISGLWTAYKIISAILALIKATKSKSLYDWTFAHVNFSCALFSSYTLMISMVILWEGMSSFRYYGYAGFGVAAIIFAIAIGGIAYFSRKVHLERQQQDISLEQ